MSSNRGFRDGTAPGASANTTTTTTQRSTSAVRPRTRRLVSVENEEEDTNTSGTMQPSSSALSSGLASDRPTARSRGGTPSPFQSRGASPLPMSHPSRVRTDSANRGKYNNNSGGASSGRLNQSWREEPVRIR